jgi:integrase
MGAKSTIKLTKAVCDHATAGEEQHEIWDCEIAGFGLRVMPSGTKSFIVRYRVDGGGRTAKRRTYTLGRYGTITVEQGRKLAKSVLGAVANGDDPGGKRIAKRGEMLVSELRDLYEKKGCVIQRGKRIGEPMKPLTKQYTMARIDHHIVPLLGRKRIGDVRIPDVEQFAKDVADGKTAKDEKVGPRKRIIVRGGEGAARKALRDLSAMYSFAMRYELVAKNPVENAAVRKTDNENERFLTLDEVRRLGMAFDTLEEQGVNPKAIAIARLWALTGCRRNEIMELTWSEVDLDRGFLILRGSKTGRSVRPLGMAAVEIFRSIEKEEDSDYVFPATKGKSYFQGTKRIWPQVKKLANLPDVTPHTLRHTMGSTSTSAGQALALTGAILGHKNPRSTAIYAHVQMDPAKRAANRSSARIASALGRKGPARAKGARGLSS